MVSDDKSTPSAELYAIQTLLLINHPLLANDDLFWKIKVLLPRIITLERCRELLETHQWDGEIGVCVECGSPASHSISILSDSISTATRSSSW